MEMPCNILRRTATEKGSHPKPLFSLSPGGCDIFHGNDNGGAALQGLQGVPVQCLLIGGTGVLGDEDVEVALKGIPGRGLDAAFGGEPRQHQRVHTLGMELIGQAGPGERAEMVFRDDRLACPWLRSDEVGAARRLANGNTVITSYGQGKPGEIKMLEVTRDKKIVWTYRDDKSHGVHEFHILDSAGRPVAGWK